MPRAEDTQAYRKLEMDVTERGVQITLLRRSLELIVNWFADFDEETSSQKSMFAQAILRLDAAKDLTGMMALIEAGEQARSLSNSRVIPSPDFRSWPSSEHTDFMAEAERIATGRGYPNHDNT